MPDESGTLVDVNDVDANICNRRHIFSGGCGILEQCLKCRRHTGRILIWDDHGYADVYTCWYHLHKDLVDRDASSVRKELGDGVDH